MSRNIQIEQKYLPAIGRFFSPIVMDSLVQKGHSPFLSEVCLNSGLNDRFDPTTTVREFFDEVYELLFNNYRNEYVYKNVIAKNILLGIHSLNTSQMLTEFRVGCCKADVVIINGTSTVYEIKSQYDTFARLEKQIKSYFEIFDRINVITSPSQVEKLNSVLPDSAGILVLRDNKTISTIRKPKSNKENVKPETMFDSLRRAEYLKIVKLYLGTFPDVPNTQIYSECKKLFCKIPPTEVHDLSIEVLKERSNSTRLSDFIENAPPSLTAYAISTCNKKNNLPSLLDLFDQDISTVLNCS